MPDMKYLTGIFNAVDDYEDPCLVEEEFPNPVIALLTAFRHYNRNDRQTFTARRRNIPFTCI